MAEISKVFAGLDTRLRKFKQEFGIEFKRRVEARTPVDTGALQRGWGFTPTATDIEVYNVMPYASWVEYGTPKMAPRGMLRATVMESEAIAEVARKNAGLK